MPRYKVTTYYSVAIETEEEVGSEEEAYDNHYATIAYEEPLGHDLISWIGDGIAGSSAELIKDEESPGSNR